MRVKLRATGFIVSFLAIAVLNACGTSTQSDISAQPSASEFDLKSAKAPGSDQADGTNSRRLETIWRIRTEQRLSTDFVIGPGDVIAVSVPDMDELKSRDARVSADNTIDLPVIGTIDVNGMGEQAIREQLRIRLKEYMKDPQVHVFVKEYKSREVAVGGMVQKPGLYTLTSRSDTILDMIGRAGGMKESASTHIIFVPASASGDRAHTSHSLAVDENPYEFSEGRGVDTVISTSPVRPVSAERPAERAASTPVPSGQSKEETARQDSLTPAHEGSGPIIIDISSIRRDTHFDVPAWPGDVIIVPAAGEVMVRGWVKNPGAFNITPGMTVLGAITAAGGEQFSSSAEVLRTAENGEKIQTPVDLSKIQSGTELDMAVQSGDVVIVHRSVIGAAPYLAYTLLNKFSTGAYLPLY